MRLGVYTDYVYSVDDGGAVWAERAFALFLARLASLVDEMALFGRLDPAGGLLHYPVPAEVRFVALPHYPSITNAGRAALAWLRSARAFWRELSRLDAVWLLGPHPLVVLFAALARTRGIPVVLGVRQDLPVYVRRRHPGRFAIRLIADALDAVNRLIARRAPVVVVGPDLARRYRRARRRLMIAVSLVPEAEIVSPEQARARAYDGELDVLTVGRLETEKNPLLLAEVLARLTAADPRWRLVVCGEGPLESRLRARLGELDVAAHADLRGYVPLTGELATLYRTSHVFLHVSWTEGFPQVLLEAFAGGLPVVATAVGGVSEVVGDAAVLVPPDDAAAAADAVERIAADEALRARLVERGLERVRDHTLEAESRRVADFIEEAVEQAPP